jgi:signal transduction histidine kinase
MDIRSSVRQYGDLLIAVLLAIVLTTEVAVWEAADHTKAIPAAVLATLPLALRRKAPVVSFLLALAGVAGITVYSRGLDNDSIGFILVIFLALYSLGRHTRGLEVWIGALILVGCIVGFMLGDPGTTYDLGDLGFAVGFVGGPWAAGLAIRLRRDREQVLSARNLQLQQDQEEQARVAVAAERSRIARELHDVVSHAISLTVLQARGARKMLGSDEAAVRRSLDAIEHTNTQALGDMRRLLSLLRDTEEDSQHIGQDVSTTAPQPSLARLEPLVEQLRASGLPVDLEVSGDREQVPPGVDLSAYRIIQEALTNVIKHAGPAATARVDVVCGPEQLAILVADDGLASGNGHGRGHGLLGIRERVAVVGGNVEAGPDESGGFVVRARLPYTVET